MFSKQSKESERNRRDRGDCARRILFADAPLQAFGLSGFFTDPDIALDNE